MDLGLQNVHVLVTGASGGIGLETARSFLEQGSKVTAQYNTNADSILSLISDFGSDKVQSIQANLSKETDVVKLYSSSASFGPVQVIVINHAIFPEEYVPVIDMTLKRWTTTMDTNLTSSFLVAREYLKQLDRASEALKEKASVVFVGSIAGKYGLNGHADYSSTKSALMYGLTLTLKNEIVKIAPKGRVNSVGPGYVVTRMVEESLKSADIRYSTLSTMPLKRIAETSDVSKQIVVLSSGVVSGHISGQIVMIDGGMEGMLQNSRDDVGC